jgi:hypothetical protein
LLLAFGSKLLPLARRSIPTSQPLNPGYLALSESPLPKSEPPPPRFIHENRALAARFSVFHPNPPTLAHQSIPTSQPMNPSLPRPKWVPSTQIRALLCVVHQNGGTRPPFSIFRTHNIPLARATHSYRHRPLNPGNPSHVGPSLADYKPCRPSFARIEVRGSRFRLLNPQHPPCARDLFTPGVAPQTKLTPPH